MFSLVSPTDKALAAMTTASNTDALKEPEMNLGHTLFSFKGRLRRQHFLIGTLFYVSLSIIAQFHILLGLILLVPNNWILLALVSKRLHDMDYSGFVVAIPLIIGPFFGTIIFILAALTTPPAFIVLGLVSILVALQIGFLRWLAFSEGTSGANQYGPDPKLPVPRP